MTLFGSYAPAYFISCDSYAREIAFEYHPRRYCRAILRFPFFLSQKRAIRAESRLIGADLRGRRTKNLKRIKNTLASPKKKDRTVPSLGPTGVDRSFNQRMPRTVYRPARLAEKEKKVIFGS